MADFGFELDLTKEDIDEIQEDEFDIEANLNEETKIKQGDIYQLGNHRLMCGDSTNAADVAKLMNGTEADLVVTDPPYNVDYENTVAGQSSKTRKSRDIENDKMTNAEFEDFTTKAFINLYNHLKPGGAFYI